MTINKNFDVLFQNQGKEGSTVNFVSAPFQLDHVKSEYRAPSLRTHGDLDGGVATLESCDPSKNLSTADLSFSSTDWKDTGDYVEENGLEPMQFSNLNYRLKLTNLGEDADFSAEIIYNAE